LALARCKYLIFNLPWLMCGCMMRKPCSYVEATTCAFVGHLATTWRLPLVHFPVLLSIPTLHQVAFPPYVASLVPTIVVCLTMLLQCFHSLWVCGILHFLMASMILYSNTIKCGFSKCRVLQIRPGCGYASTLCGNAFIVKVKKENRILKQLDA
jgi:hypothetical protein